jgi:hypothetical protein
MGLRRAGRHQNVKLPWLSVSRRSPVERRAGAQPRDVARTVAAGRRAPSAPRRVHPRSSSAASSPGRAGLPLSGPGLHESYDPPTVAAAWPRTVDPPSTQTAEVAGRAPRAVDGQPDALRSIDETTRTRPTARPHIARSATSRIRADTHPLPLLFVASPADDGSVRSHRRGGPLGCGLSG